MNNLKDIYSCIFQFYSNILFRQFLADIILLTTSTDCSVN